MRIGVALALCVACHKSSPPVAAAGSAQPAAASHADSNCSSLPFATTTPVPEASAAAWLGSDRLVVVGDSGNHGAYVVVDADTGTTIEQGQLPLGDSSDDLEGFSEHDGLFYGVISAGWIYTWKRAGSGFQLVDGPYALGPVDLSAKKNAKRPPPGDGMVCDAHGVNCGRNYEGLCLARTANADGCAGYVASKSDGHLYCVAFDASHRLAVRRDGAIYVDEPARLADCTYDDAGNLWAADNTFGLAQVFRIDGGSAVPFDKFGPGFPEVIAVRGDVFYRMSDLGGAPSLMAKFRCSPIAK
jgi:hypothetical protein